MTDHSTATTLRAAAEVIRANGFTQHSYEFEGAYCIVGALVRGAGYSDDPFDHVRAVHPEVRVLADFIAGEPVPDGDNPVGDGPFIVVTEWNDAPNRTREQVLDLLGRAADHVDPPQGPA